MNPPVSNPQFLVPQEAGSRWRKSDKTVSRAIHAGHIKVVRFGRRIMIPLAEVERIEQEGFPVIRRVTTSVK